MKFYKMIEGAVPVEPQDSEVGATAVYGRGFAILLRGAWQDGTVGLVELDASDPEVKAMVAHSLHDLHGAQMSDAVQAVYDELYVPPAPVLNRVQWTFLLALTGFDITLSTVISAETDLMKKAALTAVTKAADAFHLDKTLAIVADVRVAGLDVPTDAEVEAAWLQAAGFNGL